MNKRKAFLLVLLACVLSFVCAFAACNKKNDGGANVAVEEVTLSDSALNLQVGETATLIETVSPANATDKEVLWASSDNGVATVSGGVVTAVAAGTATVTVTTKDGGKTATCAVTVTAASTNPNPPATVAVTGVVLNVSTVTLQMGATTTATLVATVSPTNATNKAVTWTSSDTSVVTVDNNGTITALKAGTATVTVITQDGSYSSSCTVTVNDAVAGTVAVTGVVLNVSTVTLQMGATTTATLVATVAPSNATNKAVTWTSSDNTVATVNNGVVTALKAGTATITVTTTDGAKTATCAVTVNAAATNPDPDPDPTPDNPPATGDYTADGTYVLDIENAGATASIYTWSNAGGGAFSTNDAGDKFFKLSSKSGAYDYLYINMNLKAGTTITITGNARPTNTLSSKNVVLGTSLKSDSTGTVSGITATQTFSGSAAAINQVITVTKTGTIILQLNRNSGNTGCEITEFSVKIGAPEPVAVTGVSLNKTESALKVGASETLTATVEPANADVQTVTWTSSNEDVVTVVNGVVTARKAGTATVTATTTDGNKTATCAYTVTNVAVESITLNKTSNTLAAGKTFTLVATISPANATIKTVTYTSSNTAVATVDNNGVVTAVAAGNATITATADGGKTATFALTVVAKDVPVTGVTLNTTSIAKYVGDTLQLTATIAPSDAIDKSVEWTTNNSSVATVSANGLVTIVGEGTVTITVTSNNDTTKYATCVITATYQTFTVTFKDGTTTAYVASVRKGQTVASYTGLKQEGFSVSGWYLNSDYSGNKFDFSTAITEDITLYAKWEKSEIKITYSAGNFESAAIEWTDKNASSANVYYKLETADDAAYTAVDSELIRQIDSSTARVDVLGLKGGESYSFKIVSSSLGESVETLNIKKYDRSGYAHFNYTTGVGAYNDDGTLKDNALVIYVTEENKDIVMEQVCAENSDVTMFQIPNYGGGTDWKGKNASGIGWWLNNNQYTSSNAGSKKNNRPSNTYDPTNGTKLGFKSVDRPIVVRFIGTVTTPEGCTAYDCEDEGGGVGDNGHMARLKNLKNVTLEGVGEDAMIFGWGFHFVCGTDATNGQGTSFEVRNLTFSEYPEDAIGMEGQQSGSTITAPVERCWIHNNTFLPGRCTNPAESDKAEGDGSCDFKRGQYFTCSYNWFEYCHKTNLIGSSDSSLQYNMSYHHNTWWQCGSRIPLARQANVHFYNNYVYGNAAEKTTPYSWISKPALSYVHSLRASCYLFSEANYYDGCKNVTDGKSGGKGKGWNNIYFACTDSNTLENATTREQTVSGSCSYNGVDYSQFDTNSSIFYYDSANKVSDCYLTDAVTARQECLKYSGVLKHDYDDVDTSMITERPSKAVTVPSSGLTVNLSSVSAGSEVDGVKFVNGKTSSGTIKGKDVLCVFTLAENTEVNISGGAIEIANVDGTFLGHETFSGSLNAGTYYVRSNAKDKEGTISTITFKTGVTNEERVANVIALIDAIGTVENTAACKERISAAQTAYSALATELQSQVTNVATLNTKVTEYNTLVAKPVIDAIAAIGTVDANSGTAITSARTAYEKLTADQKKLVTNYNVLVESEAAYVNYEVEGINIAIANLADASSVTAEDDIRALLEQYESVKAMYQDLDDDQKASVTNYSKVTSGITTLTSALAPYEVKAQIAELPAAADVTLAHSSAISAARKAYDALTTAQQSIVGDITKLTEAEEALSELASSVSVIIFAQGETLPAGVTVSGNYKSGSSFTYNGTTYSNPLKIESSTTISITLAAKSKITIYGSKSGKMKVDGTSYDISQAITLEAGTHSLSKDTSMELYYIVIEAA